MNKKLSLAILVPLLVVAALIVVGVLFLLSPQPRCIGFPFESVPSSAGGQLAPVCGDYLGNGRFFLLNLPFTANHDKIEFCEKTLKPVEESCGFKVDYVLLEDFSSPDKSGDDFFTCYYAKGNERQALAVLVQVTNYSNNFLESDFAKQFGYTKPVVASEVDANETEFLNTSVCRNLEELVEASN